MGNRGGISGKDFTLISTLGIEFALIMCLGTFGGLWLDRKINTFPWFLFVGAVLGFALALFVLVSHAKAATCKEDKK